MKYDLHWKQGCAINGAFMLDGAMPETSNRLVFEAGAISKLAAGW